jgi:restriction system protein
LAWNKPIELIEGANLLYQLEAHGGIKARAEPPEGWRDPSVDSPNPDAAVGAA